MGFTLWCLLSVLYGQVSRMVRMEDELEELRDEVADLKGQPRPSKGTTVSGECRGGGVRRGRPGPRHCSAARPSAPAHTAHRPARPSRPRPQARPRRSRSG
jgi:hypothetical protein